MSELKEPTYKDIILSRYCEQFSPATEATVAIKKTSEQILLDLRPMAEFTTNEIAKYLISMGYKIGFSDATPVWLMQEGH